jgi:hypothetical protein
MVRTKRTIVDYWSWFVLFLAWSGFKFKMHTQFILQLFRFVSQTYRIDKQKNTRREY